MRVAVAGWARSEATQAQKYLVSVRLCRVQSESQSRGEARRDWSAADGGGQRQLSLLGQMEGSGSEVQRFGREKACSAADRSMSIRCANCDDRLKHYKSSIEITSVPPTETIAAWGGMKRQRQRRRERGRKKVWRRGTRTAGRHRQHRTVHEDSAPVHHPGPRCRPGPEWRMTADRWGGYC